jgi:hypothetical protein
MSDTLHVTSHAWHLQAYSSPDRHVIPPVPNNQLKHAITTGTSKPAWSPGPGRARFQGATRSQPPSPHLLNHHNPASPTSRAEGICSTSVHTNIRQPSDQAMLPGRGVERASLLTGCHMPFMAQDPFPTTSRPLTVTNPYPPPHSWPP